MTESPKELVPRFFDKTPQSYDKVVHWTTFGKDDYWKREIIKKIPPSESILDLACGTGILTEQIAEKFPHSKIVGVDLTIGYLEEARKRLKSNGNVSFVNQDAEKLNLNSKFDCITSSYIPKYCTPEILVKVCLNHLNPGGKIIFHDFIYPRKNLARRFWNFHFIVLNFIGYFYPLWKEVFVELPKLIRSTKWLDEYERVMKKNGLRTERQILTWESSAILTGTNVV